MQSLGACRSDWRDALNGDLISKITRGKSGDDVKVKRKRCKSKELQTSSHKILKKKNSCLSDLVLKISTHLILSCGGLKCKIVK